MIARYFMMASNGSVVPHGSANGAWCLYDDAIKEIEDYRQEIYRLKTLLDVRPEGEREELETLRKTVDALNATIGQQQDKILLGFFREMKLEQEIGRLNRLLNPKPEVKA